MDFSLRTLGWWGEGGLGQQKGVLLEKDLMGCRLPILVCLLKGGQEPGGTMSDVFEARAFDGRTSAKFRLSLSVSVLPWRRRLQLLTKG